MDVVFLNGGSSLYMDGDNREQHSHETNDEYLIGNTIHQCIEEQAVRTPNNLAVVCDDQFVTYQELNEQADQLAHCIRRYYHEHGRALLPDTLIPFCLDRSVHMMVALLAILKVGAAYVPIDPDTPGDRIRYILADSNSLLLLSTKSYLDASGLISTTTTRLIALDILDYKKEEQHTASAASNSDNLAYVIYTSGTTGAPKGVMITHANVINYALNVKTYFSDIEHVDFSTNIAFDLSVTTTLVPLLLGKKICIYSGQLQDMDRYLRHLQQAKIQFIKSTPFYLMQLFSTPQPVLIKRCFVGGEKLERVHIERIAPHVAELYDEYGPTETTVGALLGQPDLDTSQSSMLTLGAPYRNYSIYVLDSALEPVSAGAVGELYIGGSGLARGYLNQPVLTQERFIDNPFATTTERLNGHTRLYKTGDLVRKTSTGALEYIGRSDFQVKINGIRVELGEIEHVLLRHPHIQQALVLTEDRHSSRRLLAFYQSELPLSSADISAYLAQKLPAFMCPSLVLRIEHIPLTVNGKVDRDALLTMAQREREAPESSVLNETQQFIVTLLQRVIPAHSTISINDNFFSLGGHSLLITSIILAIRKKYACFLTPKEIYAAATLADIAALIELKSATENSAKALRAEVTRYEADLECAALSAYQLGIYIEHQRTEDSARAYTIPVFISVYGVFNPQQAQYALVLLAKRHKVLTGYIEEREGVITHCLNDTINVPVDQVSSSYLEAYLQACAEKILQLEHSLIDFRVIDVVDHAEHFVLSFNHHHLVADGYSIELFIRDYFDIYEALINGALNETQRSYSYYSYTALNRTHSSQEYWLSRPIHNTLFTLAGIAPRPEQRSFQGGYCHFEFDPLCQEQIQHLMSRYHCSATVIVLACCYVLLSKYSQEEYINLGVAFENRQADTEALVGCLVNVLPIELRIDASCQMSELFASLTETIRQAINHSAYPALDLIRARNSEHVDGYHPLYQIIFVSHEEQELRSSEVYQIERTFVHNRSCKFDLSFNFYHGATAHAFGIEYNTALYDPAMIERLWGLFTLILRAVSARDGLIGSISLLDNTEMHQLLHTWNNTDAEYPCDKTVHQLFEEQVARTPDAIAVTFEGQHLSYRELNQRSTQLAHYIEKHDVTSSRFVGLYLQRSLDMMIAVLAVLKSGRAYVPIDPAYPADRTGSILEDSACSVLLTHQQHRVALSRIVPEYTQLLVLDDAPYQEETDVPLSLMIDPEALAYVMYTSGTTGKPKGVLISHKSVVNRIDWMQKSYPLQQQDVVLQKTSYCFDVSVWELFWANWTGARVVMAKPEGHKDSDYLQQIIREQEVTVLHFVPSMLAAFTHALTLFGQVIPPCVRYVFCSGEILEPAQVNECYALGSPHLEIHNLYGPTEAAIDVTSYACRAGMEMIPIGRPIQNTRLYVLDIHQSPVPIGVTGELYIGGAGLAQGYLNQAELTQERFVDNPFATEIDAAHAYTRLYKTGDLVQWQVDGSLKYLGRNDHQIKIRGFRIEPGEIEQVLSRHSQITQSVVLSHKKQYLVAYYTSDAPIDSEHLTDYLARYLPEYMIPNVFVPLQEFPLSSTGKLNRKALVLPNFQVNERAYAPPRTAIEEQLCSLWQSLLGLNRVGIRDDFFQIGGHSILAIQAIGRINLELDCQVSVKELFAARTIEHLAPIVQNSQGHFKYKNYLITPASRPPEYDEGSPAVGRASSNSFALSNVQQAYLYGREGNFELGNTSAHIYQEFEFSSVDVPRLERAFNVLIQRHPALRTLFHEGEQCVVQQVDYYCFKKHAEVDEQAFLRIREHLSHKIYTPNVYPLFDIEISQREQSIVVHFSVDLLIMDGRSFDVFLDEWAQLYNNPHAVLPSVELTFHQYMHAYQQIRQSELFLAAKDYWLNKLPSYNFDVRLPLKSRPSTIERPLFQRLRTTIDKERWSNFSRKAEACGVGPTSVLLTIYGFVLLKWSGQERICINLTLFNRLPLHRDVHSIIGDFTVLELFNFIRDSAGSIKQKIIDTHRQLWDDLEHNLFDGIDVQRLVRKQHQLDASKVVAPLVLSSMLGVKQNQTQFNSLEQMGYSITQTPQIYLDNQAHETDQGFLVVWDYVEQLFDEATIKAMHHDYCRLIIHLAEHEWDGHCSELDAVIAEHDVGIQANASTQTLIHDTLVDLFEHRAALCPQATAVIHQQIHYDYQFIKQRSDAIARCLCSVGVNKEELVAVLADKGYQQVVATLGIMKSGAAYLPLNSDWPIGRIDEILQQAKVTRILVSALQWLRIQHTALVREYQIDVIDNMEHAFGAMSTLRPSLSGSDIAYVIYTSGSTGTPKGVTVSHCSVANTIQAVNQRFQVNESDRILALSNLSFDLSVYDIFGVLAQGGAVVFPEQEHIHHPDHWYQLILDHGVTLWNSVPQLMNLLLGHVQDVGGALNTFKAVLLSGDWVPASLATQLKRHRETTTVMSLGGATEGSIWSIWHELNKDDVLVPYGQAMPNQSMHVLNKFGESCPIGVTGELYIGGDGVALGYWLDPERTEASFITHPQWGRIYKTGDTGRWNKAGSIEFLGRQDNQIKRHGYRVELDEIAIKLMRIQGVEQAFVRLHENRLLAYVVSAEFRQASPPELVADDRKSYVIKKELEEALQQELAQYLPHYMLPDLYIGLSQRPLTQNGKVDYQALPVPDFATAELCIIAPRTQLEEQIRSVWAAVLGLNALSIHDDFFTIGGDSISSIQVVSKLRALHLDCRVKDLFEYRTVEHLAFYLAEQTPRVALDTEQGILSGHFGLLPLQEWFYTHCFSSDYDWSQSYLVRVPRLSVARLQEVLPALIAQHDMLRAQFFTNAEGTLEQYYREQMEPVRIVSTEVSSLPNHDYRTLLNQWIKEHDWASKPLWRLDYLDGYVDGSARLLFTLHPIIADPVSLRILVSDLETLYAGTALGKKKSSYRQWQQTLKHYAKEHQHELDFWEDHLGDELNEPHRIVTSLPLTHESFQLSTLLTEQLIQQANKAYHTEINDLLLTALAYALNSWTGHQTHAITMVGHGRESINERIDVSETVGLFTSMYPLQCAVQHSVSASIQQMKEYLRAVPHKGVAYAALRHYSEDSSLRAMELPLIHFGYLGQFSDQDDGWQIVADNLGERVHPAHAGDYRVAIHCWVANNALQVSFALRMDDADNQALVAAFKSALSEIISHCMHQVAHNEFIYTPSDFKNVRTESDLKALSLYHDKAAHYHAFPMSDIQKAYALGRLNQFEIGNVANHFYREFSFDHLDDVRLERVLNRLIGHHPAMRLVFDPYQLTQRYLPFDQRTYYRIKTHFFDEPYNEAALLRIRTQQSHHVYDISCYPLFHLSLTRFSNRVVLHFSFDMILFDLKTVTQFYSELTRLYQNEEHHLPKETVTFRDYQCSMNLLKSSHWYATDRAYWQEKINYLPLRPKLWLACDPQMISSPEFKMNFGTISPLIWSKFKQKADQHGLSYGAVLLSLYGFVLAEYSETSDFLITLTLLNRYELHPDVAHLWGDFTSTNLFGFSGQASNALELCKRTHHDLWDDMAHSLYSGLNVQRDLMVARQLDPSLAVSPLVFTRVLNDVDSHLNALPYVLDATEHLEERYLIGQTSQAWIDLQVTEQEGGLQSNWLYVAQLFPADFISALNHHYCQLIEYLAEHDWQTALPKMQLLSAPMLAIKHELNTKQMQQEELVRVLPELTGAEEALLYERDQYLLAYLVTNTGYKTHAEAQETGLFKVKERGIRLDLNEGYKVNVSLDEREYRRHKSYRRFTNTQLPDTALLLSEAALSPLLTFAGHMPQVNDLTRALSSLSGLRLFDKVLPKYKYPSAGHSYSVQCYVHVPELIEDLAAGCYYYHPLSHALQMTGDRATTSALSIEFRVYRPAIEPLYDKDWLRFSYIELGHMLYLLNDVLQKSGVGCALEWNGLADANEEYFPLARLVLGESKEHLVFAELNMRLFHKTNGIFRLEHDEVDLNKQNLLLRSSAVGQVLEPATGLLLFEGADNRHSWLQAGFVAQRLMMHWHTLDVGSCPLAFQPYDGAIYALAMGMIAAEDLLAADSTPVNAVTLDDLLTTKLSQLLPDSRLPDAYITVKELPRTARGGIHYPALPIPNFDGQSGEYVAPSNEFEVQICTVWQEVLGVAQVGLLDDFFKLGGDSILSMHVATKLRECGIECSVRSIFEHRCISNLLPDLKAITNEPDNDLDPDFMYADISTELLASLHAHYEAE